MSTPGDAVLDSLSGGAVTTLAEAQDTEAVTAEEVSAAAAAAGTAEQKAAESERGAVTGKVNAAQAASDRESARFARLRARLAQRKHERYRQAQRLIQLDAVGQDALKHAAALTGVRESVAGDLKKIADLRATIGECIAKWNATLDDIIGQAAALEPEPLRPGSVPAPSSAHVYAASSPPSFVVRNQVLHPINPDHPDGAVAGVDAALIATRQHDPSERLLIAPSGLVVPLGRDPGGHLIRRVAAGEMRELDLAEKQRYFDGEPVSY